MSGSEAPRDISVGELWRLQRTAIEQLTELTKQVAELPDRMFSSPQWNAMRGESDQLHASLEVRIERAETWREEVGPVVTLLQDRVALLQRLVYGAAATTLLAVLTAVVSLVLHSR